MIKTRTSLDSYLCNNHFATADASLLAAIARAGAVIARALRCPASVSADFDRPRNVHGELVHELDVLANDAFVAELATVTCCGGVLSEETREPIDFRGHAPERFVFFDPLDGTANLEAHGLTGSIFGISPWGRDVRDSSLQPGSELTAAGYLLYSSSTVLVLASPHRVDSFSWQPERDCFELLGAELRCPPVGTVYSLNEGRVSDWPSEARRWLTNLKSGELFPGRPYSQRYAGAFVADAHRALLQGGVFAYPGDSVAPKGKLRLQYEVNPMAFVFRAAGGAATTGAVDPLELSPSNCHERCPVVLGSRAEVESFERAFGRVANLRSA
jgi:fructose-1,6-bisphosphatase I